MKGIYKITNKLNGIYYLGSSGDLQKRLRDHKCDLKKNQHSNSKLQRSYNKYGLDNFIYSIAEIVDDSVTESELLAIEQGYLDLMQKEDVFNLSFIAGSGGAEVLRIPCYLLDLDGNIIKEYESILKCYRSGLLMNPISFKNKGIIHKKKYRVVTVDFYNTNLDTILSWKNYSKVPPKPIVKKPIIYVDFKTEILEFNSARMVANFLGTSYENVRTILNKSVKNNPNNIRYKKEESSLFLMATIYSGNNIFSSIGSNNESYIKY